MHFPNIIALIGSWHLLFLIIFSWARRRHPDSSARFFVRGLFAIVGFHRIPTLQRRIRKQNVYDTAQNGHNCCYKENQLPLLHRLLFEK